MKNRNGILSLLFIIFIMVLSGFGLAGWIANKLIFASFLNNYIPIAPLTALLFLVISIYLIIYKKLKNQTFLKQNFKITIILVILLSSIIVIRFFFNITFDLENIFIENPNKLNNALIGRMSVITAGLFILTSFSILMLGHLSKPLFKVLYSINTSIILSISSILLIGYLYNAPLLYGSSIIPVALPTAICFWMLGFILLHTINFNIWPFSNVIKSFIEKRLLKAVFPLVILIIIINGFLNTTIFSSYVNPTFISAVLVIINIPIVLFLVITISKSIGNAVEVAESNLVESEKKFKSLFETMNEGFALHELILNSDGKAYDYRIVDVNSSFERILKLNKNDIIGKLSSEVYKTNNPPFFKIYEEVATTSNPVVFEAFFEPLNKYFNISVFSPVKFKFATVYTDITTIKRAEQELIASHNYTKAVFDSVNDALFVLNADTGQIIDVNQRMCQMYGYTYDEALEISINTLSQEEKPYSQVEILEWLHKARDIGPQTFEWLAKHKNENSFWVEISITFVIMGGENRFVVSVRDSTQRKLVENSLRESEERFRVLYENTPTAYQSLNEDGIIDDVNPMWLKTLGYTRDEVKGKWFGSFLHPEYLNHFKASFPAFKIRGYVNDVQFKLLKKNGNPIHVSFEGRVGYNSDGSFKQTYCVFKDITEQKKTQDEIKKLNSELEQRIQERTSELTKKNNELERMNKAFIGREMRIKELKEKIKELENKN
ncbi:MAG: hypothetical protein A2041_08595 [Bacteroidetes bacterium GWA2_31_9b]|nr:MAG: hypothetical protein A2041_08595 [Bacteroidetes bacterium GWA2_31_9b]